MSEKSPAFQFYPKDWLSDGRVRAMGHEARGIYIDLLSIYWNDGGLPSDPKALASRVAVPLRIFLRLWPLIAPCFEIDANSIRSKRLDREKLKQSDYRSLQQAKGLKSAKSRISNKTEQQRLESGSLPVEPRLQPELNSPSPSPSPTEQPEQVTHLPLVSRRVCVREPDLAAIDRLDAELIAEEKRFSALAIAVRDSGEDVQAVLDSLPRPKTQTPFSARRWLATGLTGISRSEGGLTVLRLTCDALEARARAQGQPQLSDANRQTLENIKRVGDRMKAKQAESLREIQ